MNKGVSLGGRRLRGFAIGEPPSTPSTHTTTDAHSPTSTDVRSPTSTRTATEVRSPTSTSTEVRSPTSTSTEVRSPTNTSTEAYTADNFTATVTGGAGAGANTTVNIYNFNRKPRNEDPTFPSHEVQPPDTIKAMLQEVMSTPPPTGVIRGMLQEVMSDPAPRGVAQGLMRETMGVGLSGPYSGPMNLSHGGRRMTGFGLTGPSNLIIAASPSKRPLDANLPQATENAVLIAVKQETDPTKLQAFAQSLLPQFPSAASVLMARMAALIANPGSGTTAGVGAAAMKRNKGRVGLSATAGGLASGQSLPVGQSVFSPGGGMELRLQPDGNLVLYHGTTPLWNTWTNGAKGQSLVMQADGNLVYQGTDGKPLWNAGTNGHPGASLAVQDDGNMVVYTPDHHAIWSTQTNGFASRMHIARQGFLAHVVKDAVKIGPLAFVPGAGAAVILASGIAAAGHTAAGKKIGTDLGKNKVLSTIAKTYTTTYQQANPIFFVKGLVLGAADEALHGKNIGQALQDQMKKGVAYIADGVKRSASAAGVPPTVVPAVTAAANIAEGGNIPSNIVNAAGAVVGQAVGPAATAALQQGAGYANQMAQGVTGPVLAQIAAARSQLPPEVTHAFDSGLALQLGQHLQAKGYAAAHALLPPGVNKVVTALNGPKDLLSAAVKDVQRSLPQGAADLAHRATAAIVSQPALAKLSSPQLAQQLNISEPVARVALASMSHEVPGAPLMHPHRLEAVVGRHRHRPRPPGTPDPSLQWTTYYASQAPPDATAFAGIPYEPYPTAGVVGDSVVVHPAFPATAPVFSPPLDPERYAATPLPSPPVDSERYPATPLPSHRAAGLSDPPPMPPPQPTDAPFLDRIIALPGRALRTMSREFEREIASMKASGIGGPGPSQPAAGSSPHPEPTGQGIKSVETPDYLKTSVAALY